MTSTSCCISDLPINTFIPLHCNQLPTLLPNTSQYFFNQLTDMTLYRYTISSQHFTFHIETASLFGGFNLDFSEWLMSLAFVLLNVFIVDSMDSTWKLDSIFDKRFSQKKQKQNKTKQQRQQQQQQNNNNNSNKKHSNRNVLDLYAMSRGKNNDNGRAYRRSTRATIQVRQEL